MRSSWSACVWLRSRAQLTDRGRLDWPGKKFNPRTPQSDSQGSAPEPLRTHPGRGHPLPPYRLPIPTLCSQSLRKVRSAARRSPVTSSAVKSARSGLSLCACSLAGHLGTADRSPSGAVPPAHALGLENLETGRGRYVETDRLSTGIIAIPSRGAPHGRRHVTSQESGKGTRDSLLQLTLVALR